MFGLVVIMSSIGAYAAFGIYVANFVMAVEIP